MSKAPLSRDEEARLDALRQYEILDTAPEHDFDDLTRLAAHSCGTPIALIGLIDRERQWFKSKVGLTVKETSRDMAFCAHTILQPDLLVVRDTLADDRFATNPLVTADPHIRFYAGMPLVTQEGYALGTLCVMDQVARELSVEQKQALKSLSLQVVKQLELRRQLAVLCRTIIERKQVERRLALQYAVARVLAETATLDEATQRILQTICDSLGWEVGAIWNVDRKANVLSCFDLWHADTFSAQEFTAATRETTFPPDIGLPGRVWASGKPAWITDVTKDPNFPRAPSATQVGLHGGFAFPILLGGEVAGVIEFFSREIQRPDDDLLQMMAALGSEIGLFIERKRAEEEREKLIRQLQDAMSNIKVLRGLLPICASCKRIRDDTGYWKQLEDYISDRSEAQFTHGICAECSRKLYPGIWEDA